MGPPSRAPASPCHAVADTTETSVGLVDGETHLVCVKTSLQRSVRGTPGQAESDIVTWWPPGIGVPLRRHLLLFQGRAAFVDAGDPWYKQPVSPTATGTLDRSARPPPSPGFAWPGSRPLCRLFVPSGRDWLPPGAADAPNDLPASELRHPADATGAAPGNRFAALWYLLSDATAHR